MSRLEEHGERSAWTVGDWIIAKADSIHAVAAESVGDPDHVHCRECGRIEHVNAARCFQHGWPKCCGYTMTIDCDCDQSAGDES